MKAFVYFAISLLIIWSPFARAADSDSSIFNIKISYTLGSTLDVFEITLPDSSFSSANATQISRLITDMLCNNVQCENVLVKFTGLNVDNFIVGQQSAQLGGLNQTQLLTRVEQMLSVFVGPKVVKIKFSKSSLQTSAINETLRLNKSGRSILVTGPLNCPSGQKAKPLYITVTQESTGAIARGTWEGDCVGRNQTWKQRVSKLGRKSFTAGPAQACAAAVFKKNGDPRKSVQWCVEATLVD